MQDLINPKEESKAETHWNKEGLLEINEPYNSDEDKPTKKKGVLKAKKTAELEYIEPGMYTYQAAKSPADLRKAMQAEHQTSSISSIVDQMQSIALKEQQVLTPKIVERSQDQIQEQ